MKRKLPVIPLKNLNCTHCKLYKTKCNISDKERIYPASGKPCPPEEHYCFRIGKNYEELRK